MRLVLLWLLYLTFPALAQMPPEGSNEAIPAAPEVPAGQEKIIGSYAGGCIIGARAFPASTRGYELVNTKRNHQYGHSSLLDFVGELGNQSVKKGWGKLRVGDSSCPCGGRMGEGHASHQIGLDVDIFFGFLPKNKVLTFQERNSWDDKAQLNNEIASYEAPKAGIPAKAEIINGRYDERYMQLVRMAARNPQVDRIFVSPALKRELCTIRNAPDGKPTDDLRWLKKIRPWGGHKSHFHVRLKCPENAPSTCKQADIPGDPDDTEGFGCAGKDFAKWFDALPPKKEDEKPEGETPPVVSPTPPKPDPEWKIQCDQEKAKLVNIKISEKERCLVSSSIFKQAVLTCRDYETATTFKVVSDCTLEQIKENPAKCVKRPGAAPTKPDKNDAAKAER